MRDSRYEVVVVAGGRSRRYGSDKMIDTLDPTLDSLPANASVVCVGPAVQTRRAVRWVREEPPFAGPLAAAAAGLEVCTAEVVVLAGGDMPAVGAAVPTLVAVALGGRPAALVEPGGRLQPLASAWPRSRLTGRLDQLGDPAGGAVMRLLDGVDLVRVEDVWGASRDVDRQPPTVGLRPMDDADFARFTAAAAALYARELAEVTGRPAADLLAEAPDRLTEILPRGRDTPGHHLFTVLDETGAGVGRLWVGPSRQDPGQAWVYDVELDPSARGRGLGRAAMLAAEQVARTQGYGSIGLNVFATNERAEALYRSLGYRPERSQLRKQLAPQTGPPVEP